MPAQAWSGELGASPVAVTNPDAPGEVVVLCEHASAYIPPGLGGLGLEPEARFSHIAWDPGALPVAEGLAARLDATLVAGRVSRLVYDLNRPPEAESAIPSRSERFAVPGNAALSPAERARRAAAVRDPFRRTVAALLDRRLAEGRRPALVTVHSFTPVYHGAPRALHFGVLHDRDARLADALLAACRDEPGLDARRNEPYGPADGVTHSLIDFALPRALPNAMLEIRNDLIADAPGQEVWAARLADLLRHALASLGR